MPHIAPSSPSKKRSVDQVESAGADSRRRLAGDFAGPRRDDDTREARELPRIDRSVRFNELPLHLEDD